MKKTSNIWYLAFATTTFARNLVGYHIFPPKWRWLTLVHRLVLRKPCPRSRTRLRGFPFVRTDRPDHSSHDKNFAFNQNYPARSVRSQIACTKEMVFLPQLLKKAFFIVKMTGRVMVRPASSDFWKAPLESKGLCCWYVLPFTFLSFFLPCIFQGARGAPGSAGTPGISGQMVPFITNVHNWNDAFKIESYSREQQF